MFFKHKAYFVSLVTRLRYFERFQVQQGGRVS